MKKRIAEKIRESKTIAISSHIRPDADCIGSGIALTLMLEQLGKNVSFRNTDRASFPLTEFPGFDRVEYKQIYPDKFDIVILMEGGSEDRHGQKNLSEYFTINIDHHVTSSTISDMNWIDTDASAVGELIFDLGNELDINFTPEMGFNLFAAIASDTGSFKYSNTSYRALETASEIVKVSGVEPHSVSDLIFNSNPSEKIMLITKILSTLKFYHNKEIAFIFCRKDFLERGKIDDYDTEDILSIVRSILGVKVVLFLKEIGNKLFRASLRSKGDFDASEIAGNFNGGGHGHAAGFFFEGEFGDAKKQILNVIYENLKEKKEYSGK